MKFFILITLLVALGLFLPHKYTKPFRSVRFNIWLFLVIAFVSAMGTLLAGKNFDVYHSVWFSVLLGLMAFDVVVCKLRPFLFPLKNESQKKMNLKEEILSRKIQKSKIKKLIVSRKSTAETKSLLYAWAQEKGLKNSDWVSPILSQESSGAGFVLRFHGWQRWGDFILHISVVVILAGGLWGSFFGFEETLAIAEGHSEKLKNRPYEVTLNNFDIEYYSKTGSPSSYVSDISVRSDVGLEQRKKIVVNDPLDIDRVRFYQASWGMMPDFTSATMLVGDKPFVLLPDRITEILGTPLSIRANHFLPTFDIDNEGRPITVDYEGRNPALQIDFIEKDQVRVSLWLLQRDPSVVFQVKDNRLERAVPPPFRLLEVKPVLFSGIQVGYDPGAPIFWWGAILLLLGLGLHFYWHRREIYFQLTIQNQQPHLLMAGWNSRSVEDFQDEFLKLGHELEKLLS